MGDYFAQSKSIRFLHFFLHVSRGALFIITFISLYPHMHLTRQHTPHLKFQQSPATENLEAVVSAARLQDLREKPHQDCHFGDAFVARVVRSAARADATGVNEKTGMASPVSEISSTISGTDIFDRGHWRLPTRGHCATDVKQLRTKRRQRRMQVRQLR